MKLEQKIAVRYLRMKFSLLSFISKHKAAEKAFDLFRTPQHRTKRPLQGIFNSAEKLQFDLEDVCIRGYRWNHNAGKKVLIIHGFQSSVLNFEQYIQALVSKGYEVLAFDAPGHGLSDGNIITAPLFAKMITTIYEKFGPVGSYMAHSFGCLSLSIALENIKHNDRCRVVFIAPATETKTAIDHFFEFLRLGPEVRQQFDELITSIGGHPAEWYSIRRAIKNIKATVLWLHDEDDQETPIIDALKVKRENFPNVTFIITKGLGHRRIYRDPKVMQAIVDFL
jgi:pimeloyl-ACP methyl ester carboxylesterase